MNDLTLSKLQTYKLFAGDIDAYVRSGGAGSGDISDEEWFALDSLLQRLTLCSRGLAAKSFRGSAYRDLDEMAADPKARAAILELVASEFPLS